MILAMARDGLIGKQGGLPWQASRDLRWFKAVTLGKAMIMGRRTWESIGRPLPGRVSIVVSRQARPEQGVPPEVYWVDSLAVAQSVIAEQQIIVIGGANLCVQALQSGQVQRFYRTWIEGEYQGDTYFDLGLLRSWISLYQGYSPASAKQPGLQFELLLP